MDTYPTHPTHGYRVCGARKTTSDGICLTRPITGGTRCRKHGGASPRAKGAAAVNNLRTEAQRLLGQPVEDPFQALKHNAGLIIAFRDHVGSMLSDLDKYTYWAVSEDEGQPPVMMERVRAIVLLYTQALRDCDKALYGMTKLGIEAFKAWDQARADQVRHVVEAAVDDVELEPAQAQALREALRRRFAVLADETRQLEQAS